MKVHQVAGVNGNFGDMLNGWLWRELYPALFDDSDDGVSFVGIGTILDRELPLPGLNVVLGSGTGYAPPPDVHADPARWRIYGVRGPLTARLLGLPAEAALTDPAILLAAQSGWRRAGDDGLGRVAFVPHWKSMRYGQWQAACALAGIDFIDPCGEAKAVIRRIANARLVIAESMHAAIIADALRVPWLPIVLSREVAPFKWADWAATVGLEYTPLLLGPSSPVEVLRAAVLEHSAFAAIGRFDDAAAVGRLDDAASSGAPRALAWTREELLRDHAQAVANVGQGWRWHGSLYAEAALKRVARLAPLTHGRIAPASYRRHAEQAAAQLSQLVPLPGHLSSDAAHHRALSRCQEAVERLQADRRAGRLAPGRRTSVPVNRAARAVDRTSRETT